LSQAKITSDYEVGLTPKGETQAQCIGKALEELYPDCRNSNVFFHSIYKRAETTLENILKAWPKTGTFQRQIEHRLDLRERDGGYQFNMTITENNQYFPWYQEYADTVGKFFEKPPGGESIADVCSRIHMFLNSLRRAHPDERIFVVTHGGTMIAFEYLLLRLDIDEVTKRFEEKQKIRNCEVHIYYRDEKNRRFCRQGDLEEKIMARYRELLDDAL
jgi:broad specificity phosphatase PhoE